MSKTKEQLEEEINHTKYFSLIGDNIDALRKTEEYKLVNNVFIYCQLYFDKQTASELGYEIYDICKKCLKNYDSDKGVPFLHYFIKSLSNEKERLRIKERRENRKFEDLKAFTGTENSNNFIIENTLEDTKNPGVEDSIIRINTIKELFAIVDTVFKSKQSRIRSYLSKLLTAKYFENIISYTNHREAEKYVFIDYGMFEKYRYGGNIPTQKEIAESFGKLEQDASRTIAKFERLVSAQI